MFPAGRSPDMLLSPNSLPQGSIRKGEDSDQGGFQDYGTLVPRTVNDFGSTIVIAISSAQLIQHKTQVHTILQHSLIILLLDLSIAKRISLRRGSYKNGGRTLAEMYRKTAMQATWVTI
jgi:hypothetical protein